MTARAPTSRRNSQPDGRPSSRGDVSGLSLSSTLDDLVQLDQLPNLHPVPFTPPDKIIPGSGGRYEEWPYHPSRLGALRDYSKSEVGSSTRMRLDMATQTDSDSGDQAQSATEAAAAEVHTFDLSRSSRTLLTKKTSQSDKCELSSNIAANLSHKLSARTSPRNLPTRNEVA